MVLKKRIQQLYHKHRGCYGYRRITCALQHAGEHINHKKVLRLMRDQGLQAIVRIKKYRAYKGPEGDIAANVLNRKFAASQANEKWVTDVTEFNVKGEKLYLSPVMDLYNGEIIAYKTLRKPILPLVMEMLKKACLKLSAEQKPLLHSDQGWQYRHPLYRAALEQKGLKQSMSRKGNCLDNAAMESFFATLKTEMFYLKRFESIAELEGDIKRYIRYYNYERIKLKLNGLSPVDYRTQALNP
jgi:putative transposase